MQLVAERFLPLADGVGAVDLATNDRVRMSVDVAVSAADIARRTAVCDRLAALRHPLLVPLLDYGADRRRWFEAHAIVEPVRMTEMARTRAVLHLVRFLRAAGVELTASMAARHVATVVEASAPDTRPVGVVLRDRPPLDALRTVLEADGPAGALAVDVTAPPGGGLRTARVLVARAARLAGFAVLDARGDEAWLVEHAHARHLCVLDWLPAQAVLPRVMAAAAAAGPRRHVWIRFRREPAACRRDEPRHPLLRLEPMMKDDLMAAIFLDPELGPTSADLRTAIERSGGWPGAAVASLTNAGDSGGAGWVHETAPEYGAADAGTESPAAAAPASESGEAGVGRLHRAVESARVLAARGRHARAARVLARCAPALAARGALEAAASAACDFADLMLDRAQPQRALGALVQARAWAHGPALVVRVLVGSGRASYEMARFADAEAAFRTAAADPHGGTARIWLARTLWRRGELDDARSVLGDADPALLARIELAAGRLQEAAAAAQVAVARQDPPPDAACDAHLAAAGLHAALRDAEGVGRHIAEAVRAAERAGHRARRFEVAAERWGCLQRCGMAPPQRTRERLLRVAGRLPALASIVIRGALQQPLQLEPASEAPRAAADLIRRFQELIDAIQGAGDEAAALQVVARDTLRVLRACSVVIRSARGGQVVGGSGRPWPRESALAQPVLNGGAAVVRDGITPEAVVPVAAGGSVVGTLAVRWVAGANPGWESVRDTLAATAVAVAPLVRAVEPVAAAEAGVRFPDDLLGRGEGAERVRQAISRAASAPFPVLVEGESGSGKELVARAIHARSLRRARRFCAINCAALTEDLLEAELFGHARGAFTGAMSERAGLFEEADQGTLFLDEVAELSPRAQAKLLRVLQEGEVRRVGENLSRQVDVRIVAATNRSLEQEAQAGRFRVDLRFRLDVIRIAIPPLRERVEDIPWLAARIWHEAAGRVGSRALLGDDTIGALARYDWPGNVRELQNVIASLAVHAPRRGRVPVSLLPSRVAHEAARASPHYEEARSEFERRFIRAALARAGGRRSLAAEHLGLSRQRLVKIMIRLGLEA
ncbi:MAG TPA: sigma 54-interacting transcriptional regulator [Vicinamibacterales bacterium]|jgi:DNA-binding NtrC family response regulator/tetratricopeptide (TPR) repeat protein